MEETGGKEARKTVRSGPGRIGVLGEGLGLGKDSGAVVGDCGWEAIFGCGGGRLRIWVMKGLCWGW